MKINFQLVLFFLYFYPNLTLADPSGVPFYVIDGWRVSMDRTIMQHVDVLDAFDNDANLQLLMPGRPFVYSQHGRTLMADGLNFLDCNQPKYGILIACRGGQGGEDAAYKLASYAGKPVLGFEGKVMVSANQGPGYIGIVKDGPNNTSVFAPYPEFGLYSYVPGKGGVINRSLVKKPERLFALKILVGGDAVGEGFKKVLPLGRISRPPVFNPGTAARVALRTGPTILGGGIGGYIASDQMKEMGIDSSVANVVGGTIGGELGGMTAIGLKLLVRGQGLSRAAMMNPFSAAIGAAASVATETATENYRLPGSKSYEIERAVDTYILYSAGDSDISLGPGRDCNIEQRPRSWAESVGSWIPQCFGGSW